MLLLSALAFDDLKELAKAGGLKCDLPKSGFRSFGIGGNGLLALDSNQPPAITEFGGCLVVGDKWIISTLATEWATAALEGDKYFILYGGRLVKLAARHRRQLSKAK
jgi:hypothetical protein